MTKWQSPSELAKDSIIFNNLMHALMGLYVWELFICIDFDLEVLSGKKRFRWSLVLYFAGRYLLLFAMIGILIPFDVSSRINCQALYVFNQLASNSTIGFANITLSLRTIAIWSRNKWVIGLVVLLVLGHWSLILQNVLIKADWVDNAGCTIVQSNPAILPATFTYAMCFDFILLCLIAYKLAWTRHISDVPSFHGKLSRMIFTDGLIYFIIPFIANLVATIFTILNLNTVISNMFNVLAVMTLTIVASRVVHRLYSPNPVSHEIRGPKARSGLVFANARPSRVRPSGERPTIHVEVETFHQGDEIYDDPPCTRKPSADSLSLDDHEGQTKGPRVSVAEAL